MSEPTQEIIIVRRSAQGDGDGHHGGVWKIAFADFMTAMMAFFLVLWIVNSTSKETRSSVARYFNPIKLSDTTPARKGLNNPKESDFEDVKASAKAPASGKAEIGGPVHESAAAGRQPANAQQKGGEADKPEKGKVSEPSKPSETSRPAQEQAAVNAKPSTIGRLRPPARTEAELFDDPYAALAEIVAEERGNLLAQSETSSETQGERVPKAEIPFRDPFAALAPSPTPRLKPAEAVAETRAASAAPVGARREADTAARSQEPERPSADVTTAPPSPAPKSSAPLRAEAEKLGVEVLEALRGQDLGVLASVVEVKPSEEGLLISLTDRLDFGMFAVGSAEPQVRTVRLLETIAQSLKARSGLIIVRGHTDARPFRSRASDNWRLSSSRAQMAFHMLVRGGLNERRIDRIEGHADRRLKNPKQPDAPENRRIEIVLRMESR